MFFSPVRNSPNKTHYVTFTNFLPSSHWSGTVPQILSHKFCVLSFPRTYSRKRQNVHKMFIHNFRALNPPPSQPGKWGLSSWISNRKAFANRIANTQTKIFGYDKPSKNCEQTELWTNGRFWIFAARIGAEKSTQTFFVQFFDNPSGHGRPRRKSWTSAPESAFSCGQRWRGETFWPLGIPGRKGQECPREIRTKKAYVYAVFSPPNETL